MILAPKCLQRYILFNDTHFRVTAECDSSALPLVSNEHYGEPQQRGSIRRGEQVQITMAMEVAMQANNTLPQGVESIHTLL